MSAQETSHNLRARLAVRSFFLSSCFFVAHSNLSAWFFVSQIIHMVHEARGLDVNPITIEKFRAAGDLEAVQGELVTVLASSCARTFD
jgi:hypothetical protein